MVHYTLFKVLSFSSTRHIPKNINGLRVGIKIQNLGFRYPEYRIEEKRIFRTYKKKSWYHTLRTRLFGVLGIFKTKNRTDTRISLKKNSFRLSNIRSVWFGYPKSKNNCPSLRWTVRDGTHSHNTNINEYYGWVSFPTNLYTF